MLTIADLISYNPAEKMLFWCGAQKFSKICITTYTGPTKIPF